LKFQLFASRRSKLEIIGLILIATFLSLNSTPGEAYGSEHGKHIQKQGNKPSKNFNISIADVRVTAVGLTGANLEIVFNIRNPSEIAATLDQLDYKLYGNNIYLGEGKINDAISVPAHSNKIASSSFILNYSSVDKIGRDDLAKGTINWKISVDLGPGLTDEERPEDITVKAKEGAKPSPTIEIATLTSSESSGNDPCPQATSLDYPVPKALYLSNIGVDYKHGYEFWHPVSGYGHHLGEDIKLPEGMPVKAIGNGKIAYYGAATSYGELVVAIEHDLGKEYEFTNGLEEIVSTQKIISIYGHLRKSEERGGSFLRWKVGDYVRKGEIIGYVNDAEHNGVPTKEHLHMAIRLSDKSGAWRRDGKYWLRGYDRDKKTKCGPKCGEDFAAPSGVIEKLVEAKLPPVLTSPLKISPSPPYHAGDRINAEFTITNKGTAPITFNILTAGGRDPDGQVADFTFRRDITLSPNKSYDYKGSLTLAKAGNYHFFCAYQTPDGKWNTSVDLGAGLTDEDRIEDILVTLNNVALGKPCTVIANGAEDYSDGHPGEWPRDITDGRLAYQPVSSGKEDGCIAWQNEDHDELLVVTVTIDLGATHNITKIRYNPGNCERAETWNADIMESLFGKTPTNPGSPYRGTWTEQTGSITTSKVTIKLEKTRRSWATDWLFIGEIEVWGTSIE